MHYIYSLVFIRQANSQLLDFFRDNQMNYKMREKIYFKDFYIIGPR
jgi:hypothetical protein